MSILVLRHEPHIGLGFGEVVFDELGVDWHYVDLFEVVPKRLDWENISGLIMLGGSMHVDQMHRYPMLVQDLVWTREALQRSVPYLGICLGGQLLAYGLGAKVAPAARREVGWFSIELSKSSADDLLFASAPSRTNNDSRTETIFEFHGREFTLPEGAVLLATGAGTRNQAFRFGDNAWGLQFHPEMTESMIDDWFSRPEIRLMIARHDYIDTRQIESATQTAIVEMHRFSRTLFEGFASVCFPAE
jgi:GMP synthase (glutamine-hydrolysing)